MPIVRALQALLFLTCIGGLGQAPPLSLAPEAERTTQAHLPKLAHLLQQVREAQSIVAGNQLRCLCRRTVNTSTVDAATGGHLIDAFTYETFYIHQQPISRLLEHNHEPLTASEQAAEEIRVQGEEKVAKEAGTVSAVNWQDTLDGLILLHARFLHERRILVNGRPVIALDIQEQASTAMDAEMLNTSPHGIRLLELVATRVRGELWVDEEDHVVVRLDAKPPSNLTFGAALLAPKGFQVACYSTARIDHGMYVPRKWCGTALPLVPLHEPDPVARWNERVHRTWYELNNCRLYRSTARILSGAVVEQSTE